MDLSAFDIASSEVRAAVVDCIPHLRAFARSLTRNREQADDLVQDAIVRALGAAGQFMPGTNFKAWIFTILRNAYFNEGRKRAHLFTSVEDLAADEPSIPAAQESNLEFGDFRRAFWQLEADQREVLVLVGASGLSYEEAASVCNCAIGTIKSRVSRARAELKRLLSNDEIEGLRQDSEPMSRTGLIAALESRPTPAKRPRRR